MRRTIKPLTLLCILWVTTMPLTGQPQQEETRRTHADDPEYIPQGVVVLRGIEFARVNHRSLKLDLYLPQTPPPSPQPLVVWIHGGAWMSGERYPCPIAELVLRGYVVASIEYRLLQIAKYPAQIHDCKAAIRWLRANATKYNIDSNRIGVWGRSAGGHLAALIGTGGTDRFLEGRVGKEYTHWSSSVAAVCVWSGPTDFLKMNQMPSRIDHDSPKSPESLLIGGPIQENKEAVARANPITYVSADEPPFYIIHGIQDDMVPVNQAQLLYDALEQAGVQAQLNLVEGAGHGLDMTKHFDTIATFFDQHLKVKKNGGGSGTR